ncbi:MAG: cysteine dioxygenase family protein [Planctomycetota bacterium]|nr:cysteine dioxygenase family protein [Planctomycetota bacterium]
MLETTRQGRPTSTRSTKGLSLEEFILETTRIPQAELKMAQLEDLFHRLIVPNALIEQHTRFSDDHYSRNLLCRTPRFDMLVLGWRQGQISTIHDHLDSRNCTRVMSGTLQQRLFRAVDVDQNGRTAVELIEEENVEAGARTRLDAGGIHQMGNVSPENLVTLHIYSAPLSEITVYEPETQSSFKKRLRYSLEDEFASV